MDMSGEYRIPASREKVWAALNDPETLKASIPGCESLEMIGDDAFTAKVVAKVGPVKAKFGGEVKLLNINPPESYTISGEGKGGAAGFAKGGADVKLADDGEGGTVLTYVAKADVGGKLAQLGSRLIDGTSKKMADEFFSNFKEQVAPSVSEAASAEVAASSTPSTIASPGSHDTEESGMTEMMRNKYVWVAAGLLALIVIGSLAR
ncbi:MAG: SRPBCC family protein [Geminicoccales bacterium]